MARAGFQAVIAAPLTWHGDTLGALNIFWVPGTSPRPSGRDLVQSFADVCAIALTQAPSAISRTEIADRLEAVLGTRTIIEQAKGVLRQRGSDSMTGAFTELVQISQESGVPLLDAAQAIIDSTRRGPRDTAGPC